MKALCLIVSYLTCFSVFSQSHNIPFGSQIKTYKEFFHRNFITILFSFISFSFNFFVRVCNSNFFNPIENFQNSLHFLPCFEHFSDSIISHCHISLACNWPKAKAGHHRNQTKFFSVLHIALIKIKIGGNWLEVSDYDVAGNDDC